MKIRSLLFKTHYITPLGQVFRTAVELPELCFKKTRLLTKSAFRKEWNSLLW